jgi:hypothetical protein
VLILIHILIQKGDNHMTRTGRKQLSVQITEESFDQFNQLKEKYNLSNAKLVELLIQTSINTNINTEKTTNINTSTNTPLTEERLKVVLTEVLSSLSSYKPTEETEEEKEKKRIEKLNEIIRQNTDEHGNFDALATGESIDTSPPIPEWDEQAWLDEDFMEFSNDPNPPEIIRTRPVEEEKPKNDPNGFFTPQKAPILDEDDDW